MDINEFNNSVNSFLGEINNQIPIINATLAQSGLSLIHDRILNEGIQGQSYSINLLPAYFFTGKSISAAGEAKVKAKNKANKYKGISYTEFREANNLQTTHVDLKVSGDMWRDMAVLENNQSGFKITTVVGSKGSITYKGGQKTSDIADYNFKRYGDFLTPTKEEETILDNALDQELQDLIDKYFP